MRRPVHPVMRLTPIHIALIAAISAVGLAPMSLAAQARVPATPLNFNAFGARLLAAVSHSGATDSNTVVSPVSAGLALSLASFGANGATASALSGMLGTSGTSRSQLEQQGASLLSGSANRSDVKLEIANAIWTDNSLTPTKSFANSARSWTARISSLALSSQHAVAVINNWTDSATHGKIKRILDKALPDTARLFIANAVYFKGMWQTQFNKSLTQPRSFKLPSGRTIRVPSMQRTGDMRYSRDSGYQMVRLPYKGDHVAMYVILPDSTGTGQLLQRFTRSGWPAPLSARANRDVHVVLPRLHIERELDLLPVLKQLGSGIATDCKRADFSSMAVDRQGRPPRQLCIGKAVQKVYLDVDEQGTEAAAVTGIGMVTTTALRLTTEFVVDRPFILLIRDESTGADLFVGSIEHP